MGQSEDVKSREWFDEGDNANIKGQRAKRVLPHKANP